MSSSFVEMQRSSQKKLFGLMLVVLSFAFYGALMLVPFAPLSASGKLQLSAGLILMGEVSFWIAVLILGKEMASKYRRIDLRNWLGTAFGTKRAETLKGENNDGMSANQVSATLEK
jgi:hypothetical protein